MRKFPSKVNGIPVIADESVPEDTLLFLPGAVFTKRTDESLDEAIDRHIRGNAIKCGAITNIGKE